MQNKLALTSLTFSLVLACGRSGECPPKPPQLPPRIVTTPGPCLTRKPPILNPELIKLTEKDSLTPEEEVLLWTWTEVLWDRVQLDWKVCGPKEATP